MCSARADQFDQHKTESIKEILQSHSPTQLRKHY